MKFYIIIHPGTKIVSLNKHDFRLDTMTGSIEFQGTTEHGKIKWIESLEKVLNNSHRLSARKSLIYGKEWKGKQRNFEDLERKGWILKNKKKKWIWLRDNVLRWYDKNQADQQEPPAGDHISLFACSVREEPNGFALYTPSNSIFYFILFY